MDNHYTYSVSIPQARGWGEYDRRDLVRTTIREALLRVTRSLMHATGLPRVFLVTQERPDEDLGLLTAHTASIIAIRFSPVQNVVLTMKGDRATLLLYNDHQDAALLLIAHTPLGNNHMEIPWPPASPATLTDLAPQPTTTTTTSSDLDPAEILDFPTATKARRPSRKPKTGPSATPPPLA